MFAYVIHTWDVVVDASKPAYWQHDMEAHECCRCKTGFSNKMASRHRLIITHFIKILSSNLLLYILEL